ncbi:outer membrane protein assembly factor BamA [Gallalistipes aquisgranensis]|uniref:outer membrane protein assembly factor BamA n=1 Tax=Gallalistipes aquisgranensis TaxID=2779358 RepID=UPI001CF8B623|nr:outer membrane protein assembly factor BamA [Gallalistipes aquisgranensis]
MDYNSPKRYIINKIKVNGVKYYDTDILTASSGLQKGDTVYLPGNYISEAINRLWSQRYFSDVKIVAEPVGDSVNLEIYLKERPRVYRWLFDGPRKGEITELTENLKLKRGTELSDYVITKNSDLIRRFFYDKGFRNAEVSTKIVNDTMMQNAVNVTFVVDKGKKVKIGDVAFEGNTVFSDKRLRSALKKTHKKSWKFWKGSKLKDKEYAEDKENLIDFYNARGYRNATIVSDSIYNINDKRIGVKIKVDEGNKYFFRNVSWVGNSKYQTEELQRMLGIEKGQAYDKKTLQKRLGIGKEANPDDMSVTSLYQNDGYLFFQIDPAETIIGNDSIDLELKIFEGKQATINEVNISGNMRVNDEVIRRELYTRPGELYNRSLLMSTIRQLSQMQHFNPEALQPGINPVSNELVDISWPLEEQASDKFEVSGGWGAGMFVGSIGIQLNNLSLKNFFKKGAWRPYPQGQSQQLQIRAQSNGSYYKSFSISFTEPWLGGRKPNSLTVSTHYSDETDAYYMWQSGNKHFRTMGLAVGIGRRLSWPDQYFTLYNEVSFESYNLKDWDYFIISNGSSNIFALRTVFGRNSVDQPIYPRRGSDFSIALTLTPPYSLFDGKDYGDKNLPENARYRWIEYHKWQLKGQWYYPLSRNSNLVLMAKAEMGYIGAYNKNKPSPFEGFDVGGDGMSGYNVYGVDIIGMRGYENGSLTPSSMTGDYARAYNKYTVEVRYPFILKPSSTIYGLVFAEGGNAFKDWKSFNPFLIKRALGAGVRMYLPIVGMIGVDWGYGFDCPAGSTSKSGGQFHFMIGMQF